ncbi:MAG: hypothetical protein EXQ74_02005 [Thermoleophilia bacterium]|nr:hypothetical protein [Thermoleophilia bacterium]
MGTEPDPDVLLARLRDAAGDPVLPPLSVGDPAPSARGGLPGRAVGWSRRAVMRLITPTLAELLVQLERDRHRMQAEITRLEARIADLEKRDRD